jgi:hypothetical protein
MNPFNRPYTLGRGGLLPETRTLIGRMSAEPSRGRKAAINRLIGRLKERGLWQSPKIDALYVLAAHDSNAHLLNWFANNAATAAGGPIFTVDRGSAGDGVDARLICQTPAGNPVGNAHIGIGVQAGLVGLTYAPYAFASEGGMTTVFGSPSIGSGFTVPGPGLRHGIICWTGPETLRGYKNGSLARTWSAPVADTSWEQPQLHRIYEGLDAAFTTGRAGFLHYGQALSDLEAANLSAALNAYMVEIGAWT